MPTHLPPQSWLGAFASTLLCAAIVAQTPSWSPNFATSGLGGTVFTLSTFQNELYAGGEWFAAKGGVIRGIARFDGADWQPVGTGIDLVNYSYPYLGPWVRALTVFRGELILAGIFDRASGQLANSIARWDGTTLRPLGAGLQLTYDEADVRCLAVYNNELYAAGLFDRAGGAPVNGIARWDGSTWRAVGTGLLVSLNNTLGFARAMQAHNGSLIVGGAFDRAGGSVANNIAAWNGTSWSALGSGATFPVYGLETFGTSLVAAGQFQIGPTVEMLAAWNGSAWTALGGGAPTAPVSIVRTVGSMLYADAGATLVRFDGATWTTVGIASGIFNGYEGTSIRALHGFGSELIVGGQFTAVGSAVNAIDVASSNVIAFDGTNSWRHLGGGLGTNRKLTRILPWNGGWIAAGQFSEAGAVKTTGLALYDGDRWSAFGRFSGGNYGPIYDIAIHQGRLVVSGDFTHIDGQPFPGIAQHDGARWLPFGTRPVLGLTSHGPDLYGYGSLGLQKWNGATFATVALANSIVTHLHSHSDGLLYLATSGLTTSVQSWNGVQTQLVGTPNAAVDAIASYGSELVIGGQFTSVNATPAVLMARWDGASWRAMPGAVSGYTTYAFCELEGTLYAGVSGDPRGMILALVGAAWQPLGAGTQGVPQLLFPDAATASVYASGEINFAGDLPTRCLAEWRLQPAWRNRLHTLPGAAGAPGLAGRGSLLGGTPISWTVTAPANTPLVLALGASRIDAPLLGGTLVPSPDLVLGFTTDGQGTASLGLTLPLGLAPGARVFSQAWVLDATGPRGITATNALEATVR